MATQRLPLHSLMRTTLTFDLQSHDTKQLWKYSEHGVLCWVFFSSASCRICRLLPRLVMLSWLTSLRWATLPWFEPDRGLSPSIDDHAMSVASEIANCCSMPEVTMKRTNPIQGRQLCQTGFNWLNIWHKSQKLISNTFYFYLFFANDSSQALFYSCPLSSVCTFPTCSKTRLLLAVAEVAVGVVFQPPLFFTLLGADAGLRDTPWANRLHAPVLPLDHVGDAPLGHGRGFGYSFLHGAGHSWARRKQREGGRQEKNNRKKKEGERKGRNVIIVCVLLLNRESWDGQWQYQVWMINSFDNWERDSMRSL